MKPAPLFSICHTTARPDGWQDSYHAWLDQAFDRLRVEYVLCVDRRWGFESLPVFPVWRNGIDKAVWNTGRKCLVDGANIAAANSTGKVLIINSDDFFPEKHWDEKILRATAGAEDYPDLEAEFAIRTHPGDKYQAWLDRWVEVEKRDPIISRLMTLQILSRARYERFGYALYPEFLSMMADTDFTDQAEFDGVVIEARDIEIEHRHPFVTGMDPDSVSRHENEQVAHELGARIYARRHQERAGAAVAAQTVPERRKHIAILRPVAGSFDWRIEQNWSNFLLNLAVRFELTFCFQSCSNQYFVRDFIWHALERSVKSSGREPDYILSLDSDNLLTAEDFDLLLDAVEHLPEGSAVGGWYWIDVEPPQICVRMREPSGNVRSVTMDELQTAYDNLRLVEASDHIGFGALLMPYRLMKSEAAACGGWPFMPMIDDGVKSSGDEPWEPPYKGDDVSFCRRAISHGWKFYAHPEVYLQHLKLKDAAGPETPWPRLKRRAAQGIAEVPKVEADAAD